MSREMQGHTPPRARDEAGFTIIELLIVMTMFSVLVAVGLRGFRNFNRSTTVDQAARALSSDVTLTRSFAVRRGGNVSLVADEGARRYSIRDASGNVLGTGDFSAGSGAPLTLLDVKTTGDSITFNSRGMLVTGTTVEVDVGYAGRTKKVEVSALGRTRIALAP